MQAPNHASSLLERSIAGLKRVAWRQRAFASTPWLVSCHVRSFWWRVALGVVAAVIGVVLRLAIQDFLGNRVAYVTFYPVVAVVALFGGSVSGIVAALLCAAVAHVWLFPLGHLGDWIGLSVFLVSAAMISGMSEALHHAWSRASYAEERAADKEQLQIVNERLRLAISAGAIGAWDFDVPANITDATPQMREMFGFSPDALVNPDVVFATVLPEDRPGVIEVFRAALDPARDGQYFAEYRIHRVNDNAERWISSQAQAVFVDGKPVRLIGISRDVTQNKAVEKLLKLLVAGFWFQRLGRVDRKSKLGGTRRYDGDFEIGCAMNFDFAVDWACGNLAQSAHHEKASAGRLTLAEMPQVDHRIGQRFECIVQLAEAIETKQQVAELIFPAEHTLDRVEPLFENGGVEKRFAASLESFSTAGIRVDIGNHPAIENGFAVSPAIVNAIQADDGSVKVNANSMGDARHQRQGFSQ